MKTNLKISITTALLIALTYTGCNHSSSAKQITPNKIELNSLSMKQNSITTTKDSTKVELIGNLGAKVYINNQMVGEIPESGKLLLDMDVDELGTHYYNIYTIDKDGKRSETKVLKIIKKPKGSELGKVSSKGEVASLAVSPQKVAFLAEKGDGVEIIGIGFNDTVSSDLLSTIDIDAYSVVLAGDGKKLYIKDKNGAYSIVDISDLSNPTVTGSITELPVTPKSAITQDGRYSYYKNGCGVGLKTKVSDKLLIKDKNITDVAIVDDDKYLLASHGDEGLYLYDISDRENPKLVSKKSIDGFATALSLLKDDGVLFVANKKGVNIYNLDILLHEMGAK